MINLQRINSKTKTTDKILIWASCIVLLTLSIAFYKQRIAFSDAAAYTSHIIARDRLEIAMGSRFVGGLTQLLLYIGMHTGLPLKVLLILYSINFALIPVACALLSLHWFKEIRTAWSILMFYTLMAFYMFYYPVSEYQTGLCLFLFYIGLYQYYRSGGISTVLFAFLSLLFIPTFIFCHPLGLLVFVCWLIFRLCCQPEEIRPLALISMAGILTLVIKRLYFVVSYEEQRGGTIRNFLQFSFNDLFGSLGTTFLRLLIQDYFLLIILSFCIVIVLIMKQKKLAALIFILILTGWWVLVTVSFKNERYDQYYEHLYQAIPLFVAVGFTTFVLPLLPASLRFVIMTIIMVISFAKILNGHGWLDERFAWMQRCFSQMSKLHCKKAIFTQEQLPGGRQFIADWSLPYESLLISSIEDARQSKVILMRGSLEDALTTEYTVLDVDPDPLFPQLGETYFRITGERYCIPEITLDKNTMEYLKTGKYIR